jgi:hypothetical protein
VTDSPLHINVGYHFGCSPVDHFVLDHRAVDIVVVFIGDVVQEVPSACELNAMGDECNRSGVKLYMYTLWR